MHVTILYDTKASRETANVQVMENVYENGEINYKGDFVNGKKVGLWIAYYYNGQLEYKGNFDNGKKNGIWEYYSVSGNILEEHSGIYKNDKKVSSKT